jgi:DNA-binding HxlR family transcriptional regulator
MDERPPFPPETMSRNNCEGIPDVLNRVGGKWTVLVIGGLSRGPVRYKDLQRHVEGISQRMLTLTLKGLEADGLVRRTVFPTVPPRVDYELTDLGMTLIDLLAGVHRWAIAHRHEVDAARAAYAEKNQASTFPR